MSALIARAPLTNVAQIVEAPLLRQRAQKAHEPIDALEQQHPTRPERDPAAVELQARRMKPRLAEADPLEAGAHGGFQGLGILPSRASGGATILRGPRDKLEPGDATRVEVRFVFGALDGMHCRRGAHHSRPATDHLHA